jgi:hypothetical protein
MFDLVRETVSLCQGTNPSPFRFFGDHNRCSALLVQHRIEIALLFGQYNFIERVRGFPGSDNQQENRDGRHCRHGLSAIPLLLSCEPLVLQYAEVSLSRISITLSLLSLILVTLCQGCRFRQRRRSQPGPKAQNVSGLAHWRHDLGSGIQLECSVNCIASRTLTAHSDTECALEH